MAQNFAALSALIGEGRQKGHMKMHLDNILLELKANEEESKEVKKIFVNRNVSYKDVRVSLEALRKNR